MSESTASVTRGDLKRHVLRFWGASRTLGNITSENATDLADIIAGAERQFYSPPNGHQWSFLAGVLSISITNGTATYDLPDDYAGMLDQELALSTTASWAIKVKPLKLVLEQTQTYGTSMPSGISKPLMVAEKPKTFTASTGQRWQAQFWPTPTGSAAVTGRYRVLPNVMSDDTYYPMGGQPHAQTLIEACLSLAEQMMNDEAGVHTQRFNELMAASVAMDLRLHQQEAA